MRIEDVYDEMRAQPVLPRSDDLVVLLLARLSSGYGAPLTNDDVREIIRTASIVAERAQ